MCRQGVLPGRICVQRLVTHADGIGANMTNDTIPWGVHRIGDIYHPDVQSEYHGRWVSAVAEPYTANRLVAAWWVLTGRAYALRWPKHGELEAIWKGEPAQPIRKGSGAFVPTAR